MNNINYNHLYNFFVIGQSGSLKAASITLGLSQSSLSEQMKSLEDALNKKLFCRVGRSLSLTNDGRHLFTKAENLFCKVDNFFDDFDGEFYSKAKLIEIGVTTSISIGFMFQILKPLFQMSGTSIRITESTGDMLLMAFKKREIDFLITHEKLSKALISNLKSISIQKPELLLVGANKFTGLLKDGPKGLENESFFLFTVRSQLRWEVEKYFKQHGINPSVKAEVDDPELIKTAVLNELGLAILPEHTIRDELKEKKLVILGVLPASDLSIYAYYIDHTHSKEFSSVLSVISQQFPTN